MQQGDLFMRPHKRALPVVCQHDTDADGPCPYVSCRHHLLLDAAGMSVRVHRRALAAVRGAHVDDWTDDDAAAALAALDDTCALDVAARGEATTGDIAAHVGMTRQAVDQLLADVLERLQDTSAATEIGRTLLDMTEEV